MYSPKRYRESVMRVKEASIDAARNLDKFSWSLFIPVNVGVDGDAARHEAADYLGLTYQQDFRDLITMLVSPARLPKS